MRVEYTNDLVVEDAVISIWEDLNSERPGMLRAYWTDGPNGTNGSTVIGYCSPGGSHKTIGGVVSEVRRLGYTEPIYRNGRKVA